MFASSARPGSNNKGGLVRVRVETLERVKQVLEHLSLYIGLAIYTALGAKVDTTLFEREYKACDWYQVCCMYVVLVVHIL